MLFFKQNRTVRVAKRSAAGTALFVTAAVLVQLNLCNFNLCNELQANGRTTTHRSMDHCHHAKNGPEQQPADHDSVCCYSHSATEAKVQGDGLLHKSPLLVLFTVPVAMPRSGPVLHKAALMTDRISRSHETPPLYLMNRILLI